MISEFKIFAPSGDFIKISHEYLESYEEKWITLQINDGKEIEVSCKELSRALRAIEG